MLSAGKKLFTNFKEMGCHFCLPNDKSEIKTFEADLISINYELRPAHRVPQRLYTVREEQQETSECSDIRINIDVSK